MLAVGKMQLNWLEMITWLFELCSRSTVFLMMKISVVILRSQDFGFGDKIFIFSLSFYC